MNRDQNRRGLVPMIILIVTLVFVLVCALIDIRTRRIPNAVSLLGLCFGLAFNAALYGAAGVWGSLAGLVAAVVVMLPPFALDGIGGGDVKMMAAVGALLGPVPTLFAILLGLVLGGAIMIVHLAKIGRLREKLNATASMYLAAVACRSLESLKRPATDSQAVSLPYSVPLGLGTILVMVWAHM